MIELDRIMARSKQIAELASAPWMQTLAKSITLVANAARWNCLSKVREGELFALADRGDYELAADQARRLLGISSEPIDHYAVARTLAYTATAVASNHNLSQARHGALSEELSAQAVAELAVAWERGYILRDKANAGWLETRPAIIDIRQAPEFAGLVEREDFAALVRRIETEEPPTAARPETAGDAGSRLQELLEDAGLPK